MTGATLDYSQELGQPMLKSKNWDNEQDDLGGKPIRCNRNEVVRCLILVTSTFVAHMLSSGMSYSTGVYYIEFLSAFNQGSGITSLVTSLNLGALCGAGPLTSILVQRLGCSNTIIIGGLLSSIGIFACAFASNIYMVLATFGIITGFGYGLVFASCLTQITCHIHHWRAACSGISLAGVGMGIVINPILTEYLIHTYTWKGAILITSSLTMNICLCGFVIRIANNMPTNDQIREICVSGEEIASKLIDDNCDKVKSVDNLQSRRHSIWSNSLYWCLHVNTLLFCYAQSIVFTHISAFALSKGFTQMQGSALISVLGVSNIFGRCLLGVISNIRQVNVKVLHIILIGLAGFFLLCCTFLTQYFAIASILALVGIALSEFGPVLSEVTVDIVGVEHFSRGYGFLLISMALGTLLGAPTAGKLYEHTQVYDTSFYLGAFSFICSALVFSTAILSRLFYIYFHKHSAGTARPENPTHMISYTTNA